MAERFQTVFTLPENLYLEGAPVRITAGALQRIAANGQMLAQVTLQNIGPKPVKGAKIVIRPLDVAGRPLGLPTIFPILDFYAERGALFGQDAMIPLPDFSTRRIAAFVTEVIFADDTVWAAPAGGEWTPTEPQKPLAEALGDPELVKQYQLRFGEDAAFQPDRVADLWRCTCGAVNRKDENICHACRKVAGALFDPELMQELGKEKDARLEAERIEREAREEEARKKAEEKKAAAEAARKKIVKILKIAVPALVAVIAAVLIVTDVVIPNSKYNKAVALMEDGKYEEAVAAFEAMDGYKDSDNMINEVHYREADALFEDGKYAEAVKAFQALKDYKDSAERVLQARYSQAAEWMEQGKYKTAGDLFKKCGDYEDAEKQAAICAYHRLVDAYLDGEKADLVAMYNGLKELPVDVPNAKPLLKELGGLLEQVTGNFSGPVTDSGRRMYMQAGEKDVVFYIADVLDGGPNTPVTKAELFGNTYYLVGANINKGTTWRTSVTWYVQDGKLVSGETVNYGIVLTPTDAGFDVTDTTMLNTFAGTYTTL